MVAPAGWPSRIGSPGFALGVEACSDRHAPPRRPVPFVLQSSSPSNAVRLSRVVQHDEGTGRGRPGRGRRPAATGRRRGFEARRSPVHVDPGAGLTARAVRLNGVADDPMTASHELTNRQPGRVERPTEAGAKEQYYAGTTAEDCREEPHRKRNGARLRFVVHTAREGPIETARRSGSGRGQRQWRTSSGRSVMSAGTPSVSANVGPVQRGA